MTEKQKKSTKEQKEKIWKFLMRWVLPMMTDICHRKSADELYKCVDGLPEIALRLKGE